MYVPPKQAPAALSTSYAPVLCTTGSLASPWRQVSHLDFHGSVGGPQAVRLFDGVRQHVASHVLHVPSAFASALVVLVLGANVSQSQRAMVVGDTVSTPRNSCCIVGSTLAARAPQGQSGT